MFAVICAFNNCLLTSAPSRPPNLGVKSFIHIRNLGIGINVDSSKAYCYPCRKLLLKSKFITIHIWSSEQPQLLPPNKPPKVPPLLSKPNAVPAIPNPRPLPATPTCIIFVFVFHTYTSFRIRIKLFKLCRQVYSKWSMPMYPKSIRRKYNYIYFFSIILR